MRLLRKLIAAAPIIKIFHLAECKALYISATTPPTKILKLFLKGKKYTIQSLFNNFQYHFVHFIQFRPISGLFQAHFRIISGPLQAHFRPISVLFQAHFRPIFGPFQAYFLAQLIFWPYQILGLFSDPFQPRSILSLSIKIFHLATLN